ncbi:MAG: carboxylesterase family protein [Deltaproteobacteria bacterium]|nr:carboxylesterase family protein [Deltaproteobacteria bacterium]
MPLRVSRWKLTSLLVLAACGSSPESSPDAITPADGAPACGADVTPAPGLVVTQQGAVHGALSGNTYAFLGIPFAQPPTGALRWQPPQPLTCRATTLEATTWPAQCPQKRTEQGSTTSALLGEEDCLYLNVWQPTAARATPRPVMVWIHGGGNVQGGSSEEELGTHLFEGQKLAERGDAIVVTTNYRLGPLGFLAHPALTAASGYGGSGNYGLMDQIAALTWVKDNIAAFGGDPARVMVFGESAGGLDVCALLASPMAAGLFSRAAIESGGCVGATLAVGEQRGSDYVATMGCDTAADPIACLRAIAPLDLVKDLPPVFVNGRFSSAFGPVVDGKVLAQAPLDALASGAFNQVPLILGTNTDEAQMIVPAVGTTPTTWAAQLDASFDEPLLSKALALYPPGTTNASARAARVAFTSDAQFICPARTIARTITTHASAPVWRYEFRHAVNANGAFHGIEIFFVFSTLEQTSYAPAMTDADRAIAASMLGYWSRLAASGDPDGAGAPAWPRFDTTSELYLGIDAPPVADAKLRDAACDFWDIVYAATGM